MKLQIALDDVTLEGALELVKKVRDYIDIIEIGTPFVYEYSPYSCKDCIETKDTVTAILKGIFTYISMHVY